DAIHRGGVVVRRREVGPDRRGGDPPERLGQPHWLGRQRAGAALARQHGLELYVGIVQRTVFQIVSTGHRTPSAGVRSQESGVRIVLRILTPDSWLLTPRTIAPSPHPRRTTRPSRAARAAYRRRGPWCRSGSTCRTPGRPTARRRAAPAAPARSPRG